MTRKFDRSLIPPSPTLDFEHALLQQGCLTIAGIDEAGRGCLAGPVAAAAVILPIDDPDLIIKLDGVRDSKQMTAAAREQWAVKIQAIALGWAVDYATPDEIDGLGIANATRLAALRAIAALTPAPQFLLLDYFKLPQSTLPQQALIKGDQRALSIAAASVLAKTSRDALLKQLDAEYPGYGFARHKGYGTAAHLKALEALGICAAHRKSFAPIKALHNPSPAD